jgi:hypothetical protein
MDITNRKGTRKRYYSLKRIRKKSKIKRIREKRIRGGRESKRNKIISNKLD